VDSSAGDIVFRSGDLVAGHPDAQHFLGLKHHMLLAWDGTGARSDLYVYDLNKRAKVLEVDGFDDYELRWVDEMMVEMWVERAYDKRAVAAGCPDTVPGTAELDSLMRLDLAALTLRPTSRFRCIVGQ
jgi:hypothetical protein